VPTWGAAGQCDRPARATGSTKPHARSPSATGTDPEEAEITTNPAAAPRYNGLINKHKNAA